MTHKVLDLFAGTGVGVGCRNLGVEEYGVEVWDAAVKSRDAAGMTTPYRDAWDIDAADGLEFDTLWASPPCQTFSTAGSGSGRKALNDVVTAIRQGRYRNPDLLKTLADEVGDARTALVLIPLAYVWRFRPGYVVFEQVTPVLPVWEETAKVMRDLGYSVWTGILDAADYGVPQNRKRAYLIARRDGRGAKAPAETTPDWVSMYEALGWGLTHRPSPTLTSHLGVTRSPTGTQRVYLDAIDAGEFVFRPGVVPEASRVATKGIGSQYAPNTINVSSAEGAVLQSYPRDFPFQGTKTEIDLQIGNAVPPRVAEAVLSEVWS